jgi:hypothetical protein
MFKLKITLAFLLMTSAILQPANIVNATPKPCFQGASGGYVRPRLKVGSTGRSISSVRLNIRSQPGSNKILGKLYNKNTFKVIDGPECLNSHVWWKIQKGNIKGWVGEANPANFNYWLEPIRKKSKGNS